MTCILETQVDAAKQLENFGEAMHAVRNDVNVSGRVFRSQF